ncbi:MAG: glycosyltransferase family 39 protein [Anaerolineae bacterium]|nr:glycosyltransferase family 39 protein [Anaerolineae bacterium]
MPKRSTIGRSSTPLWLWALIPMLLAAALVAPFLGRDIFDVDEAATMIAAGARHLGPLTIAEAVDVTVSRWPGQALGHVLAFAVWGRFVGWSEVVIRALPWLLGLLTLAWVYRLGRDLFSARVAWAAVLLMSTAVVFLNYMHIARSYGAMMLFAAISLWGYWRVALAEKPPKREARAALLLGATGVIYSQYFGAVLVPALGLFHLFLVRKDRRWWQAVALLALAVLLALPQAPDLLGGIAFNHGKEDLHGKSLRAPQVLSLFLRYLSNDTLNPGQPVNSLLLLALPLLLLFAAWTWRKRRPMPDAGSYLAFTSVLLLLLLVTANEILQVLEPRRVRYLAGLWPPATLLFSAIMVRPLRGPLRHALLVPIAWIAIAGTLDFRQEGELVRHSWVGRKSPVSVPVAHRIASEAFSDSFLLVDPDTFRYENRSYELYTGAWGNRRATLQPDANVTGLTEQARAHESVWLLYRTALQDTLRIPEFIEQLSSEGWTTALDWQDGSVTLRQLRSPLQSGKSHHGGLEFDRSIRMTGAWISSQDGRLRIRVDLQGRGHYLLSHYSLALHVIDPRTGERVAQGDVGVGPGIFVPVRNNIDVSDLPSGDYELQVALYDWQTGERLSARDLQTGTVSDMHVLQRIRID